MYLFCKGLRSGCTAVVALLSGNKLYIGWLGDSQAVLSKDGKAVSLMEPHKPENQVMTCATDGIFLTANLMCIFRLSCQMFSKKKHITLNLVLNSSIIFENDAFTFFVI